MQKFYVLALLFVMASSQSAFGATPGKSYTLVRKGSGKCLDLAGGGNGDGTPLLQWTCHGGSNQQFRLDDAGDGRVRLVDSSWGKCVDVANSGTADGTQVQLWSCNGSGAQAFTLEDVGGGYMRIRNPNSGKCVDVNGSGNGDGVKVQLWSCNSSNAQAWQFTPVPHLLTLARDSVRIDYNLDDGTASFSYDGAKKIANFYAGVQLATYVTSKMYATHTYETIGEQTVVTSSGNGLPTMKQLFILNGGNKLLTRVTVEGANLASNWMGPVVMDTAGGVDIGSYGDDRVLWVPWDNDAWVSYNSSSINRSNGTAFEVAAFFDRQSRAGIVVGSVTHDQWKTGVYYKGNNSNKLDALNVFGGATDRTWTHDLVAHGKVSGNVLYSPIVFVGYGPDWRDLLEEYADANAYYVNKLPWSGGVPFGWNSWGKLQDHISYDKAVAVSDFIRTSIQPSRFGSDDGTVYVNLDSYWDNMSDDQLAQFVARCHANGQKAGIYWTPWVDWGKWVGRGVEGTNEVYEHTWLRDGSGKPIELDGAYAVDPTHPAIRARVDYYIDRFRRLGFQYVKLDFLSHGALESTVRADPAVQTGIQAYNQGMQYLRDRVGGSMFISESIAPLFPYQYGHARRIACDVYGNAVGSLSAFYELNSLSFGWWMSGRLYTFNDPDHMVFEGFSANDNMVRLMSGVVSGTVFLNGDDLSSSSGQALARTLLTNERVNAVARLGRSFRPVEAASGTDATDLFVLRNGNVSYVAVFNFGSGRTTRSIDLARAGLDGGRSYVVTDLWTGGGATARGSVSVTIDGKWAKLLQLQ